LVTRFGRRHRYTASAIWRRRNPNCLASELIETLRLQRRSLPTTTNASTRGTVFRAWEFSVFRQLSVCVIAIIVFIGTARAADATEWFVAPGAAGTGISTSPFGRIQDAVKAAQPGDIVSVRSGTYVERFNTVRNGSATAPITVRAAGARGSVVVTAPGRVLTVNHSHVVVEGLVLDGQYGLDDTVRISTTGHFFQLRNVEVRRSTYDLLDLAAPQGVLVENSLIHHALNAANGRTDAHGIVAGAVRNLTIRNTEIHTFSGDGVQVDPARSAPGWSGVTIEGCRIWLAPLPGAANGFAAGAVPGENAVDTKASATLPRSTLVIRNTTASGFRAGLISNMAAFNLKENIDAVVDRVTVYSSHIAFRLRGATSGGAVVAVKNAVVYDVATAFRYEDNIQNLRIWNSTLGRGVTRAFQEAGAASAPLDVRNLLVLGPLSAEASHPSNRSVSSDAFVNAAAHDYRLAPGSPAIDAGIALSGVATDRLGVPRPQGYAYDIGAYEWYLPSR
jgi:hypothetical protein